jgi:hypothetical protein
MPQVLIEPQHLVGPKPWCRQHFQHARRDLFPELLEAGIGAGPMQLGYDVCDSLADAGNFRKPVFRDQTIERHRQRGETVGRPGVGLGPIGNTAAQRGPLRVFAQKLCDRLRIGLKRFSKAGDQPAFFSRRMPLNFFFAGAFFWSIDRVQPFD